MSSWNRFACKVFGHSRKRGWWGDSLYGDVIMGGKDGTGRSHAYISLNCDRCGSDYVAARFHPSTYGWDKPKTEKTYPCSNHF